MKGIYWQTLTFKKSVIYLIKVNYTSYNYTPCNSTWTCLLVLEAAPEIGMDYGIIVNKVSQGVLKKLIGRKNDFINTLFAGIPQDKRCVYSNIFFLEKKRELEDEEDQFLSPDEFKNETGLHVLTWQSCWSRVSKVSNFLVSSFLPKNKQFFKEFLH